MIAENTKTGKLKMIEKVSGKDIVAIVGDQNKNFPPQVVYIYDYQENSMIKELIFGSEVLGIKLVLYSNIFVSLEGNISFHNYTDKQKIFSYKTTANPKGMFCLSSNKNPILIYQSIPGNFNIVNLKNNTSEIVQFNKKPINYISISLDGSIFALATSDGINIVLYDIKNKSFFFIYQRAGIPSQIISISFDRNIKYCAFNCIGKAKVHIFPSTGSKITLVEKRKETKKEYKEIQMSTARINYLWRGTIYRLSSNLCRARQQYKLF